MGSRHRLLELVAVVVLTSVAVGAAALAVIRVSSANAEVVQLSRRNVARLTLMGEIRGQQARINDGVANMFASQSDPALTADVAAEAAANGKRNAIRAAATMDRMMRQYGNLVRGTRAEGDFAELMQTWEIFYNGMNVYVLGGEPFPGVELIPGPQTLGSLTVSVTDGLDDQADLERADAAAVGDRQHAAYRTTIVQVSAMVVAGLALAAVMAVLAMRAATARRRSEQRFRALVQESSDVINVLDADGQHLYVSPSVQPVMGYMPQDLIGTSYSHLVHPDDVERAGSLHAGLLDGGDREVRTETRIRHVDGSWHWHEVVARNLLPDPAVQGIVVNHRDVTERRQFQDRLAYDATHDTLTGLANRAAFLADLDQAIADRNRHRHSTAVLFVDLNDFKQVNDTWGHEVGDRLLVAVARVLERSVLGADTVARLGGDEFGIVLAHIEAPSNAQAVARRIVAALSVPLDGAGRPIHARASIGIAVTGSNDADADELLRRADIAMYHVKRQRISGWRMYSDELRTDVAKPAPTVEDLQAGIAAGELRLQYQPVVALHSGDIIGVEALVRWHHPALGVLGPHEFIPLAEATGLIVPLGMWVLEEGCSQVRAWQQRTGTPQQINLSVNLSPRQLDDPALVPSVLAILERTALDAHDLVLEITEDALVNDVHAVPILSELRSYGIRLALDDFGTGYSSLRYLTNLPVDILKLDRCFVAELNGTPEGSAVAEAVIRLSQALNLDTVAEGIENDAQATELTLLGYPLAQGYHFAKPMDPERIEALLDDAWPRRPTLRGAGGDDTVVRPRS
jgi:diguanylate cyclase (GGDEF)-like protein/PAS domain S-box-containing protein